MTNSIREIEDMEVIFIIGSNTKETHPVIANRMIKAHRKGAHIIVADPRRVPMVRFAHTFLQLKPGTDIALLNAMANVVIKEGLADKEFIENHTDGYGEWADSIEEFTPERAEEITGVPKEAIIDAAKLYGGAERAGIFYTMGITQHTHGTANVSALANLALLTGHIGKPHSGVNPLRGQNNVQGACDVGALPNVYPGYQDVEGQAQGTLYHGREPRALRPQRKAYGGSAEETGFPSRPGYFSYRNGRTRGRDTAGGLFR
jgi:predicted molibdopterin-dependent oxidoreductase YjgC